MNIRTTLITSSLIAASLISGAAHAALQGRDLNGSTGSFEAYYDTDRNITWLADANVNGQMTWNTANTWAANLSFTDGVSVYDNWRLPITPKFDGSCGGTSFSYGYCVDSEMGHLFFSELSVTAGQFISTSTDPDRAKFTNLQGYYYWAGTGPASSWAGTEPGSLANYAFLLSFQDGYQAIGLKDDRYYALAVSPGDVGAVPEAQTYALMLAGLGLIGWRARRRG